MPASQTDPTQASPPPAADSPRRRRRFLSFIALLAEAGGFIGLSLLMISGKLRQAIERHGPYSWEARHERNELAKAQISCNVR